MRARGASQRDSRNQKRALVALDAKVSRAKGDGFRIRGRGPSTLPLHHQLLPRITATLAAPGSQRQRRWGRAIMPASRAATRAIETAG